VLILSLINSQIDIECWLWHHLLHTYIENGSEQTVHYVIANRIWHFTQNESSGNFDREGIQEFDRAQPQI
jgi:hypothetical protein